ncbi:MAG: NAD-dependent epimerase/dehydratase family protein [Verrucomicrobia bacterium]|nr:NAD-dependent epimerase/dehydratase family protein [Verrucomicrobiota bacterium]MBU6446689.1 NAD-dependent epimerase/dehydratase family protein [Verrucomicrobiota bacterium]
MHIVVTGGAGFIGSHLVDFHLKRGDQVRAFDSCFAGKKETLPDLGHAHFQFFMQELHKSPELTEAVRWADRIYHMASILGYHVILKNPIATLSQNIQSCECILELMAETKSRARLTIASSSGVYSGEPASREDATLQIPPGHWRQQSYRMSKIINELTAHAYIEEKSLFCAIPRIFNVAGPNQRSPKGMIIPRLVEQALKEEPLTVYGNGQQKRTFCHVDDVVQALHLLLESDQANGQIVNIGSEEEISIIELATWIKKLCNSRSEISFVPYQKAYGYEYKEVMRSKPNLEKLEKLTGFKPKIPLEETLKQTIAVMKKQL